MTHGTVVLAGILPTPHSTLDRMVAEFGWSIEKASGLRQVAELSAGHNVVAVLFSPRNMGLSWDQALRGVLDAAPGALPILCHGFSDMIDWPQVADAGGFHSLLLPFAANEVRQSLGFVRARRAASPQKLEPKRAETRQLAQVQLSSW